MAHRRSNPRSPVRFASSVAACFLDWQDPGRVVQAFQATWLPETASVDESKACALLTERVPNRDKCAASLVRLSKVHSRRQNHRPLHTCATFYSDASAHRNVLRSLEPRRRSSGNLKLPFVESDVLREVVPYLKRTLNFVDVEILSVEKAQAEVEADKA